MHWGQNYHFNNVGSSSRRSLERNYTEPVCHFVTISSHFPCIVAFRTNSGEFFQGHAIIPFIKSQGQKPCWSSFSPYSNRIPSSMCLAITSGKKRTIPSLMNRNSSLVSRKCTQNSLAYPAVNNTSFGRLGLNNIDLSDHWKSAGSDSAVRWSTARHPVKREKFELAIALGVRWLEGDVCHITEHGL